MKTLVCIVAAAALPVAAAARAPALDPAEAQPLVAQLAADLAGDPSATEVLQRWCADRALADPPVIVADRKPGGERPASAEVRALLQAAPGEPVLHRRVALTCGRRVLSRADNWYRPGQLTAAMNDALETTDRPFGAVVRSLDFHRESLEARVLLTPDAVRVPAAILRNRALLETPDGTPFSLVEETYSRTLLAEGDQLTTRRSGGSPREAVRRDRHRPRRASAGSTSRPRSGSGRR